MQLSYLIEICSILKNACSCNQIGQPVTATYPELEYYILKPIQSYVASLFAIYLGTRRSRMFLIDIEDSKYMAVTFDKTNDRFRCEIL